MATFRQLAIHPAAIAALGTLMLSAVCGAQTTPAKAAPPAAAPAGIAATRAIVTLNTAISSRGEIKGKEIKMSLAQTVVLPDGTELPRGTLLRGVVAQSSQHSKTKPNGALLLLIDEATPKKGDPIPLLVKIKGLSPSAASEIDRVNLPGARLGGTSNSGGTQQLNADNNDHTEIRQNEKVSGLKGVYVDASSSGSGVVFALGEDVYLDDGVALTLVIARRQPAQ